MITKLISWSIKNKWMVIIMYSMMVIYGIYSVYNTPVDALPDLSENQVIIYTEWMGRNPQIIEDQITYPLTSNLQGIPKVKNIRGASMFGMSFVFIIFEDDAEIYWARARVLERLNYATRLLPPNVTPTLGPDGTGLGHVYWYTLDAPGYDLGELRALQDWYVRFGLQTVKGVSEVASFGGYQKQYQIDETNNDSVCVWTFDVNNFCSDCIAGYVRLRKGERVGKNRQPRLQISRRLSENS